MAHGSLPAAWAATWTCARHVVTRAAAPGAALPEIAGKPLFSISTLRAPLFAPPTSAVAAAPSGSAVAAASTSASNPSNHLLARQQQSRQNFARQQNLRRTESDAQLLMRSLDAQQPGLTEWQQHERRLQIGKRLLQRQSEDLQFALRQATSGLGKDASSTGSSLIPMPELVVEYVPAGRVKQRFDRSSAQHVRRVQAARDAAAARSQLMGSEQLSGSTSDAFKSLQ